jgi:hypothetical protein
MKDVKRLRQKGSAVIPVLIIVILLLAGGYYIWRKASSTPHTPDLGSNATSTQMAETCSIVVNATTTLYNRPSKDAAVFGTITAADQNIVPAGETADGWIGFDPGVAQAPNVGPFRLRYIPPNSGITLIGKCSDLPVVPNIAPKQCFAMAQTDAPIFADTGASSTVVATMHSGDYIEAIGRKGKDPSYFVKVLSTQGSMASGTAGYVSIDNVNLNGTCTLPTVK